MFKKISGLCGVWIYAKSFNASAQKMTFNRFTH